MLLVRYWRKVVGLGGTETFKTDCKENPAGGNGGLPKVLATLVGPLKRRCGRPHQAKCLHSDLVYRAPPTSDPGVTEQDAGVGTREGAA